MSQKRRDEARRLAQGRTSKRARHKTSMELFWGSVLGWDISQLDRESTLVSLPNSFASSGDFYSRFKPLILAEAKATLARTASRGGSQGTILLKPSDDEEEVLVWGARLLFFNFTAPLRLEQRDCLKPGQVFALSTTSKTSTPVLAAWANGCTRSGQKSALVLMVTDPNVFIARSPLRAQPIESLLALQRMFDACIRQPNPPFLSLFLAGRKGTHTRFSSDEKDSDDDAEVVPSPALRSGAACSNDDDPENKRGATTTTIESWKSPLGVLVSDLAERAADTLNLSQRKALDGFTVGYRGGSKLSLVQGPPGSGKTSFLVATLLRLLRDRVVGSVGGGRVLVCAPSNKAIVLLLERFFEALDGVGDEALSAEARSMVSLLGVADKIDGACSSSKSVARELLCWQQIDVLATTVLDLCGQEVKELVKHRDGGCGQAFKKLVALQSSVKQRLSRFYSIHAKPYFEAAVSALKSCEGNGRHWRGPIEELARSLQALASNSSAAEAAAGDVLSYSHFVFATIGSAGASALREGSWGREVQAVSGSGGSFGTTEDMDGGEPACVRGFATVLVDEAGQAVEAEIFIPIGLGAKRLLLVGDPQQLPATTFSRAAQVANFDRSLLARLMDGSGGDCGLPVTLLNTQYRMAEPICRFPSTYFYDRQLMSADGNGACARWNWPSPCCSSTSQPLANQVLRQQVFAGPLSWVEIGDNAGEERDKHSLSIRNQGEAMLVVDIIRWFVDEKKIMAASDIVVITMYSAQVALLRGLLRNQTNSRQRSSSNVAVHTVDSFQGSEASVVLLSLVRSNQNDSVGFLKDGRRINVAITRAKDLLLVIGDSMSARTKAADTVVASLYRDATSRGLVKTERELRIALEQDLSPPSKEELIAFQERHCAQAPPVPPKSCIQTTLLSSQKTVSVKDSSAEKGIAFATQKGFFSESASDDPEGSCDFSARDEIARDISKSVASKGSKDRLQEDCSNWSEELVQPNEYIDEYQEEVEEPVSMSSASQSSSMNYQLFDEFELRDLISDQREEHAAPSISKNLEDEDHSLTATMPPPPTGKQHGGSSQSSRPSSKMRSAKLRKGNFPNLTWRGPAFVVGSRRLLGPMKY